jgi:hypothetical protein
MTHHKTRRSRSKKNKTRGGGKEKKYNRSGTARTFDRAPKKNTNSKKYHPPLYAIPKKEWNALTEYQKQMASVHGVGPNK